MKTTTFLITAAAIMTFAVACGQRNTGGSAQPDGTSKNIEDKIITDVLALPEMQFPYAVAMIVSEPSDGEPYYTVGGGSDIDDNIVTSWWFHVYITPEYEIKIYDVCTDSEMTLGQWRISNISYDNKKIDIMHVPREIDFEGNFVAAYRYTDNTGDNIIILTETEVTSDPPGEDGYCCDSYKSIYAYHYLEKNYDWIKVWEMYDSVDKCFHYPIAKFVKDALYITDFDNDGIAEIWIMYIKSCNGGLDTDEMLLKMYNNKEIYTMKGESKLVIPGEAEYGGKYTFDEKFLNKNTPAAFVDYAKELWEKHISGNSGE
jgi:hypothetical protein